MRYFKILLPLFFFMSLFISCRNPINKEKPIYAPDVVFIGNSIIEYWNITYPAFFTTNNYLTKGISGQPTDTILARFQDDVIKLHPKVVFIEAGINDIGENYSTYDPSKTFNNIKSMADLASKNGIKVVLASVLPSDSIHWNKTVKDVSKKVIELNGKMKAFSNENGHTYVDLFSSLVDVNGKTMVPEYTSDGVHLTKLGYEVIKPISKNVIDKVLNSN